MLNKCHGVLEDVCSVAAPTLTYRVYRILFWYLIPQITFSRFLEFMPSWVRAGFVMRRNGHNDLPVQSFVAQQKWIYNYNVPSKYGRHVYNLYDCLNVCILRRLNFLSIVATFMTQQLTWPTIKWKKPGGNKLDLFFDNFTTLCSFMWAD